MIVDRYANIIRGQMFGHTHKDAFEIQKSSRDGEFAGVAFENPCMTTHMALYPSYRVYHMDSATHAIADYEQFRFDLKRSNEEDKPRWYVAYRFKEYYNMSRMEDRNLAELAQRIRVSDSYYKRFARMMYEEGPQSDVMMANTGLKEQTYCRLATADQSAYEHCIGGYAFSLTEGFIMNMFNKYITPRWEYAV